MRASHLVEAALITAVSALVRVLPRRGALGVGAAVGQLGWWSRLRRRVVLDNLAKALPDADPAERRRVGARAARNLGRTFVEFLRFAGAERHRVGELVDIEGLDELKRALADGRGAVVVTAHLGSWALYATALAARGVQAALLVGRQRNPGVQRLILSIPQGAIRFIPKGRSAPRAVLESLGEGRAALIVADHHSSVGSVWVPFMGHEASTLPLPGALVVRHELPLFALHGHRTAGGGHRVRLERLEVPAEGDRGEREEAVARLMNERLGAAIQAAPEHYYWYHRRWKPRRRPAPAAPATAP